MLVIQALRSCILARSSTFEVVACGQIQVGEINLKNKRRRAAVTGSQLTSTALSCLSLEQLVDDRCRVVKQSVCGRWFEW